MIFWFAVEGFDTCINLIYTYTSVMIPTIILKVIEITMNFPAVHVIISSMMIMTSFVDVEVFSHVTKFFNYKVRHSFFWCFINLITLTWGIFLKFFIYFFWGGSYNFVLVRNMECIFMSQILHLTIYVILVKFLLNTQVTWIFNPTYIVHQIPSETLGKR